jgi:hypothetical protein
VPSEHTGGQLHLGNGLGRGSIWLERAFENILRADRRILIPPFFMVVFA